MRGTTCRKRVERSLAVREERRGTGRAGEIGVPLEQPEEVLALVALERDQRDQLVVHEPLVRVEQVRHATGHAGAEVASVRAEDDDRASRHVLAAVVADPFDHCGRTRVADAEALSSASRAEELATGRTVEERVSGQARIADVAGGRRDHDPAAAHRLADVVVRLADEAQLDPGGEEGAKALARRAFEPRPDATRGRPRADRLGDRSGKARADRPVGVRDRVPRLDEPCTR